MYGGLRCKNCGQEFSRGDGFVEASLAYLRGEELGDFVCPFCGSGDRMIEEIWLNEEEDSNAFA